MLEGAMSPDLRVVMLAMALAENRGGECKRRGQEPYTLPARKVEVFALECWRCGAELEISCSQRPYRCYVCAALLAVDWRGAER